MTLDSASQPSEVDIVLPPMQRASGSVTSTFESVTNLGM